MQHDAREKSVPYAGIGVLLVALRRMPGIFPPKILPVGRRLSVGLLCAAVRAKFFDLEVLFCLLFSAEITVLRIERNYTVILPCGNALVFCVGPLDASLPSSFIRSAASFDSGGPGESSETPQA